MSDKRHMSLPAAIAMGVGCIIGAGIFAITPVAVKIVGNGVTWGAPLVAVILTIIFTAVSLMGIKANVWVQNISVVVLLVALAIYIFGGWSNVQINPMDVIVPTIKITKLWAVMGMLHGSLIGANALIYMADEIENPRRTIPKAFIISTFFCAVVFAVMSYITVGVVPVDTMGQQGPVIYSDAYSLGLVAETFMSKPMLVFFISGGALLAVVTSLNAVIIMFSRGQFVAARDGLYPKVIARMNKYNVPAGAILMNAIIAILAISTGYNLEDVVKITLIPGLLLSPVLYLSIFALPKRYPLSYKNNFFRIPHKVAIGLVVIGAALSFLLGGSMIAWMKPKHYVSMIIFYALAALYVVIRRTWLKKNRNIDLFARMRRPHEPWEKAEASLAADAAAKAE